MCIQGSSFNLDNLRVVMFIIIVTFYGNTDEPHYFEVPREMGKKVENRGVSKYTVTEEV